MFSVVLHYNAVYHQTTFGVSDVIKAAKGNPGISVSEQIHRKVTSGLWSFIFYAIVLTLIGLAVMKSYPVAGWFMLGCGFCYFVSYFVIRSKHK